MESQAYSFQLVREALKRDALIIIMRSRSNWLEQLPELADRHITLNSAQNVAISPGNMSTAAWAKLTAKMSMGSAEP